MHRSLILSSSSSTPPSPAPLGVSGTGAGTSAPSATMGEGASSAGQAASAAGAAQNGFFPRRFPRMHARYARISSSRSGRATSFLWRNKRGILLGLGLTFGLSVSITSRIAARQRDHVYPDSWLVLKVHPGAIVECASKPGLAMLLNTPSPGEDAPRVIEMFDLLRTLKWAQNDDRIRGIFADFSGLHVPSGVSPSSLGLAQIEELIEALHEFKTAKKEQRRLAKMEVDNDEKLVEIAPPVDSTKREGQTQDSIQAFVKQSAEQEKDEAVTIAWTDSFDSQADYVLASAFDEVYVQPSGTVPLVGTRAALPFFKRALDWLGVTVNSEARREHKSMVSSFIQDDQLPPAQLEDEVRLLGELSQSIAHSVAVNRFPELEPDAAADKVAKLLREGPFPAPEAAKMGLITDVRYKRDVVGLLGGEEGKVRSLNSYARIMKETMERSLHSDQQVKVAVVYLLGTISNAPGEFSASQAIRGLREAGKDDKVSSIVLRIDSGGGDVVASDSLWDAVRRVQEQHKKPVIASFGNVSASGGYYAAANADAILACESTITGSIGVAALRPTITQRFFERIGVRVQTIFSGSNENSALHALDDRTRQRFSDHVDALYDDFLTKVCDGRQISRDVIEDLAGGRVWTGLAAWAVCNPDEAAVAESGTATAPKPLLPDEEQEAETKNGQLTVNWTAVDITKAGEMSTIRIDAVPREAGAVSTTATRAKSSVRNPSEMKQSHAPASAGSEDDDALASAFIEELERAEAGGARSNPSYAKASNVRTETLDDDSKLAVAAHDEAEASQRTHDSDDDSAASATSQDGKGTQSPPPPPPLGPYGKGLIDAIGGIWDAGTLAASMSVEREVAAMVVQGQTLEQATASVRPQAEREEGPEGQTVLHLTPQLVRYPKERSLSERVWKQMRDGDQPSLSLAAFAPRVLSDLGAQMRDAVASMAVQLLVRSWNDPAFVERLVTSFEREQKAKMDYTSHVRY